RSNSVSGPNELACSVVGLAGSCRRSLDAPSTGLPNNRTTQQPNNLKHLTTHQSLTPMRYVLKSRLFWSAVILAALSGAGPAQAQRPILKTDKSVTSAFRSIVARPGLSTVKILCKGKEAALGTVVGEDGWIVTKNSELNGGKVTVKTRDGKVYDATVVGVEDKFDLAMLKINAKGLKPIEWAASKSAEQGDWLAAPGLGDDPVGLG